MGAGGASAAGRFWRVGERHFVTIALKTEIRFTNGAPSAPRAGSLLTQDALGGDGTWLEDATDLGLYLGRGEALFFGSIHGAPASDAYGRFVVMDAQPGRSPLVDKRVRGRLPPGPGPSASVRIDYRSSRGHPSDPFNPVGRLDPLVEHTTATHFPAAMAPLSPSWPARRALLRPHDVAALTEPTTHVTEGFNFNYFHAAPPDQRCARHFDGSEVVILSGLSPRAPVEQLELPKLRAEAFRVAPGGAREPLALVADLMRVFGDEGRVTLTWRATLPLAHADEEVVVAFGVTADASAVEWEPAFMEELETIAEHAEPDPPESRRARAASSGVLGSMTLPFQALSPDASGARRTNEPVPGSPWAGALPVVPGADAAFAGTALSGVNFAELAAQALARRAERVSPPPLVALPVAPQPVHEDAPPRPPMIVPVATPPKSEARVTSVPLRNTPGSRFLLLMLAELRKRDRAS